MAKRLTIFYSWQSDSPSNLNRNFIEKALHEALKRLRTEATLESALRDADVVLDKDTQGVPGSPPIAETILKKIEDCAVFVADLSFVGESKSGFTNASGKPRLFPNPNVLIEYGYALHCHSHAKLVGIMNTAYGEPTAESLPFDLRHLRWPMSYHLADPSATDKGGQFEKLVETLAKAIGLILLNHPSPTILVEKFVSQKPTKNAAIFFESPTDLIGDRLEAFTVPNGGTAYLRLYPSAVVPPIALETEARDLAVQGNLQPIGRLNSYGYDRDIFGAIVRESPIDGKLYQFTQLFLSREIWGVEAGILNVERLREQQKRWKREDFNVIESENFQGHIANGYIEQYFVEALRNYIAFARDHLRLPLPLQIEAGLVGIKGYPLIVRMDFMTGKALRDTIIWPAEVSSYEKPAWEILAPFFDRIWNNCGVQRTAQQQAALAKGFGG